MKLLALLIALALLLVGGLIYALAIWFPRYVTGEGSEKGKGAAP